MFSWLTAKNKKACFMNCVWVRSLSSRSEEISQLMRRNETTLSCMNRAFQFSQQIYNIVVRDEENVVISTIEHYGPHGQITDIEIHAHSTATLDMNPVATICIEIKYNIQANCISHAFIYDFTSKVQNNGYGTLLMKALIQYTQQFKVSKITGWLSFVDLNRTSDSRAFLHHFYQKFGFEITQDERIVLNLTSKE